MLESWFADRDRELEEIQQSDVLINGDSDEISQYLRTEVYQTGFSTLHVVDSESGKVIGSSDETAVGTNLFNHIDEETAIQSSFVSQNQYTPSDDEPRVAIGTAHRDHRLDQLIVGEVEADVGGPELPQAIDGASTDVDDESATGIAADDLEDDAADFDETAGVADDAVTVEFEDGTELAALESESEPGSGSESEPGSGSEHEADNT